MTAPDKIFLIGFMGVGKSHWGAQLAAALGYPFVDLDDSISRAAGGRTISEIFEAEGEAEFRLREAQQLNLLIGTEPKFVMACGGGTPCFLNNLDLMKSSGLTIWLIAEPTELLPRLVAEKSKRPLLSNLSDEEIEALIAEKMDERKLYYQQADRMVRTSDLQLNSLLEQLHHE